MAARRGARRGWRLGLLLLALPLSIVLLLDYWLQPERLGALLIQQVEQRTGWQMQTREPTRLAYWPGLQLELRGLTVYSTEPALLFSAERIALRLPLSVLWDSVRIDGIELDQPRLWLAPLQRWLAEQTPSGPPAPLQLPELGPLQIQQGQLLTAAGELDLISLAWDQLRSAAPTQLQAQLLLRLPDRPALPLSLQLKAQLEPATNGLHLTELIVRLSDRAPNPALELAGQLRWDPPAHLQWALQGSLADWPDQWPDLPPMLVSRLPQATLQTRYAGDPALQAPLQLRWTRQDEQVEIEAAVPRLLAWWQLGDWRIPPPARVTGQLQQLQWDGVQLQGIRIEHDANPSR